MYSACIQLVVSHDDDVCALCILIVIMYSSCIELAGCLRCLLGITVNSTWYVVSNHLGLLLHMIDDDVYSACIQLVALHDDDVYYYMLFHMMMCTVHILIMYSVCIGLAGIAGCLPVRYNWIPL